MSQNTHYNNENLIPSTPSTISLPSKSPAKIPGKSTTVLGAQRQSVKRISDTPTSNTSSKRSKYDDTAREEVTESSEGTDPDEQIICTAYIDIEVATRPSLPNPPGRRSSRAAKTPATTYKRSPQVLRFSALITLDDLISLLAEKLDCEPNSVQRANLMWRFETPANATPKPFGTQDGMVALQEELRRTAGKKSVIFLTAPVKKKRRNELDDGGGPSEDEYDETAGSNEKVSRHI